jgi:hypothetical protein
MSRDIDEFNDEMKAAGVRIFVGGLQPASSAKSLRMATRWYAIANMAAAGFGDL